MPDNHELLHRLRVTLAETFPDRARAELFAHDTGLNLARIDLSGAPDVFWQRILDEANRHGKLLALLDLSLEQAPAQDDLAALRETLGRRQAVIEREQAVPASTPSSPPSSEETKAEWDVFISYAWDDKQAIARPLADALKAKGLRVWFDDFALSVGDKLRRSIDRGLARSAYGIVILSPHFFEKEWPQKELDGLVQRESRGDKVVLPVWHNIDADQIRCYSPSLADRIGVRSDLGVDRVVSELLRGMGQPTESLPGDLWIMEAPVRMELVRIPAGEFLMGSNAKVDTKAETDELPQHRLYLPDYYIGKHPVTVAQYAAFARATRRKVQKPQPPADHPATGVTWNDAVAFCRWLSRRSNKIVRLPTEAEWEKAARGADGRLYPWGDQAPDTTLANYGEQVGGTTPVGQYPAAASPFGALDMAGNVREWTASMRYPYPYREDDGRNDPKGTDLRVLRGGSWLAQHWDCRCANRFWTLPDIAHPDFGFRVVVSL